MPMVLESGRTTFGVGPGLQEPRAGPQGCLGAVGKVERTAHQRSSRPKVPPRLQALPPGFKWSGVHCLAKLPGISWTAGAENPCPAPSSLSNQRNSGSGREGTCLRSPWALGVPGTWSPAPLDFSVVGLKLLKTALWPQQSSPQAQTRAGEMRQTDAGKPEQQATG